MPPEQDIGQHHNQVREEIRCKSRRRYHSLDIIFLDTVFVAACNVLIRLLISELPHRPECRKRTSNRTHLPPQLAAFTSQTRSLGHCRLRDFTHSIGLKTLCEIPQSPLHALAELSDNDRTSVVGTFIAHHFVILTISIRSIQCWIAEARAYGKLVPEGEFRLQLYGPQEVVNYLG